MAIMRDDTIEVSMHDILDWLPRIVAIVACQIIQIIFVWLIAKFLPKFKSTKLVVCGMWYALLMALVSFDGAFLGTFVMKAVAIVAGFCTVSYMVIDGMKEGLSIRLGKGDASVEIKNERRTSEVDRRVTA